jgi:hypothetical protein
VKFTLPAILSPTLRLMLMRTATKHAAFFTPFLRPGMRLLDCGYGPGTITTISNRRNSVPPWSEGDSGRLMSHLEWRAFMPFRFQMALLMRSSPMPCANSLKCAEKGGFEPPEWDF